MDEKYTAPQIGVFNRSNGILGYQVEGFNDISLPPGEWKEVPREFVYTFLTNEPLTSLDYLYRPLGGRFDRLTITANIDMFTGYGVMSANIISQLASLYGKEKITLWPIHHWHYPDTPELTQELMRKPHQMSDWSLAITIPDDLHRVPSPNIIMYSMWETGTLPAGWAKKTNWMCKALVVPCESQAELWKEAGVTIPIFVVPLGIDPLVWNYLERPARHPNAPFTMLSYGILSSRKSPIETIAEVCWRAFGPTHGAVDDWKLILKTRRNALGGAGGFIAQDPHLSVRSGDYLLNEMADLCYESDCGIALSKFEGFGLPAREQMATGLPVILSQNTGHLDECNPDLNIPIPDKRMIPAEEAYSNPGEDWKWHEPDYEIAARKLREEYEDWKARGRTQSEMGRRAALHMHKKRTWAHTALGLKKVFTQMGVEI